MVTDWGREMALITQNLENGHNSCLKATEFDKKENGTEMDRLQAIQFYEDALCHIENVLDFDGSDYPIDSRDQLTRQFTIAERRKNFIEERLAALDGTGNRLTPYNLIMNAGAKFESTPNCPYLTIDKKSYSKEVWIASLKPHMEMVDQDLKTLIDPDKALQVELNRNQVKELASTLESLTKATLSSTSSKEGHQVTKVYATRGPRGECGWAKFTFQIETQGEAGYLMNSKRVKIDCQRACFVFPSVKDLRQAYEA